MTKRNLFKFSLLITLGLATTLFTACKDKDDDTPAQDNPTDNPDNPQTGSIVGTWKYVRSYAVMNGQTMNTTIPGQQQEMVFYADGKLSSTLDGDGTYTTQGSALSVVTTKDGVTKTVAAGKTVVQNGTPVLIKSQTYSITGDSLKISLDTEYTVGGVKGSTIATGVYAKKSNNNPTTIAVTGISLNKTTLSLAVGGNEILTSTVLPTNATNKTVTWTSSNNSIASVANGKITAVAAGTATITAKAGDKTATCMVTVAPVTVDPATITIGSTKQYAAVIDGKQYQMKAEGGFNDIYNGTGTYGNNNKYENGYVFVNITSYIWEDISFSMNDPEYFTISKGALKIPYGHVLNNNDIAGFVSKGTYNYSKDLLNGVEITWYDNDRKEWSTSKGTGVQTGSSFEITDVTNSSYEDGYKVRILFTCTLYDGNGNSKKVTNGVYVGIFRA